METGRRRRRAGWVVVAAVTAVVIVVGAARGLWQGYEPTSDIALIELRAREVFTRDNPLLGAWSSGSVRAEQDFNHPGPLQFVVYALPVRLVGASAGLALTSAAINAVSVGVIGLAARRAAGARAALVASVVTAVLAWNMGGDVLYDAWQPNVIVLPFLAMCMLAWATATGGWWALPPAVLAGSLVLQSHLSYVLLVPALLGLAVAAGARADRRAGTPVARRPLLVAAAVWLVLWAPPLWEQLFGAGDGNLSRLARSGAGGDGDRVGLGLGTRIFGSVVAVPSGWIPPGYDEAIPTRPLVDIDGTLVLDSRGVAGAGVVVIGLLAVGALVGWVVWDARRHRSTEVQVGIGLVAAALVSAWVTVLILPVDLLGLTPHKLRFLWPVAAFTAIVAGTQIGAALARRGSPVWWATAGTVAGVSAAALTLTTPAPTTGPVALRDAWPAVRALRAQMGALDGAGTVRFDQGGLYYLEPYTWPLMAELERRGIPFVVDQEATQRNVGGSHHRRGAVDGTVYVRVGEQAETWPAGTTRIAFVDDAVTGPAAVFLAPGR